MRKLAAEFVGTFALVFAVCGAIVVNDLTGATVTHVGVALTFGLIVLAMVYTVGDVSGAHLNPAVTLGFFVARRFPGRRVLPYVLSQCGGALAACLCLSVLFPLHSTLGATLPGGGESQSFVLEMLLTGLLMFVVLSVSTGAKEKGITAGIAVGAVVALEALFAGPICGAPMNPSRSLAPAVASLHFEILWVYRTAPAIGAVGAVLAYRCVHERPCCCEPEGVPMKRVIFVCVENSNRSQMAEAFARLHGVGKVETFSAGSRPSGTVNPKAIAGMKEVGYDLTTHGSKGLEEFSGQSVDMAVTMRRGDECPLVLARQRVDWKIPDPKELPPEQFNEVRDLIERKVKELLAGL
ncbi:aquaporin [Limnoglobus roseus]|uniref:Aquaporin n=1 Tax=Limnoglobus roseus TaxID=2598579 RepID=A0A5C1AHZ0_9BACT|nr:aquaporin [Limnoglobus roseus]QEL16744.1 aquaporin [Limnoglobus roseus]